MATLQNLKDKNNISRGENERMSVGGNGNPSSSIRSALGGSRDKPGGRSEHGMEEHHPHSSSMSFDFGLDDQQFDPLSGTPIHTHILTPHMNNTYPPFLIILPLLPIPLALPLQ